MPAPAERVPPHDLQAEKSALGSVLIKPAALDDLADLEVDDFFLPAHREIVEAMRAVAKRAPAIDVVILADELKARGVLAKLDGGENYLLVLANATPTAENVRYYAGIVANKAMLRRLIATCAEIQSTAYGDFGDEPDAFLAEAQRKLGEIELHGAAGPVRVGDAVSDVLQAMEDRGNKPESFLIPTGIKSMDHRIGGLRGGHLIVVAANPGRGKTAWAVNVAVHAALAEGIPVLIFSIEMETYELIERMLAGKARVNGRSVSHGRMNYPEWQRVTTAASALAEYPDGRPVPLYVDDRKLTAGQVCAQARRWRAQHPDSRALIVIDYLGLVLPDEEEKSREREVAKMSRAFKLLGHKTKANASVIMCCQLNRDNKGKDGKMRTPVVGDLRESGSIEADADMVILPWWEGDPGATGRHPADLIIGKHRGGPKGVIRVDWEPEFLTFTDPLDPLDEVQNELPFLDPDRDTR